MVIAERDPCEDRAGDCGVKHKSESVEVQSEVRSLRLFV